MAIDKQVKIYRYLDLTDMIYSEGQLERAPVGLNYKTHLNTSLKPKRTFIQGELQMVEWFADYDANLDLYSDLVLRVEVTYTRDAAGFALHRDTTRTWLCEDDTDATPVKVTRKYYVGKERDEEGVKRRKNITAQIKSAVGNHLVLSASDPTDPIEAQTQLDIGRQFYEDREVEITHFIELSRQEIHANIADDVTASPDAWLDDNLKITPTFTHPTLTVRDYLLAELNIWGL